MIGTKLVITNEIVFFENEKMLVLVSFKMVQCETGNQTIGLKAEVIFP